MIAEDPGEDQMTPTAPMAPVGFGAFIAPYHAPAVNHTLQLRRDFELVRLMDDLGYDEAWIGEHHSGGYETIASPEVFIAAAAEQTRRIRLGSGVNSLAYHHPFILADRFVQLDHQTRGRAMLGAGPGQLPSDAFMMGIDPYDQRRMMIEALDAIVPLLRGETVSMETDWFRLREARLQIAPFTPGGIEVAVASAVSPAGATVAGRHGLGMLSVAAGARAGYDALDVNWGVYESQAAAAGLVADRTRWRVVTPMHLAETREQAWAEARHGVLDILAYMEGMSGGNRLPWSETADIALEHWTTEGFPSFGIATIGTPDDAIARIESLVERSGGFGTFLLLATDTADWEATGRSYRLFAEHVIPHFQGAAAARDDSLRWVGRNAGEFFGAMIGATQAAIDQYGPAGARG
jgi:limonene 1,2-monooxygenase